MTASTRSLRQVLVVAELGLVAPAMVFVGSLFLRSIQSVAEEPAASAHHIVMWYAARQWTLWVLLIGLPGLGLVVGITALLRDWRQHADLQQAMRVLRAHASSVVIAGGTAASAAILGIVALHLLTT